MGRALSEAGLIAANASPFSAARPCTPKPCGAHGTRSRAPAGERVPFAVDAALKLFAGTKHLILVGAKPPTAFFAYPGKPSLLAPPDAAAAILARPEQDEVAALENLADELGAPKTLPIAGSEPKPQPGCGKFTPEAFARTLAALLPENCIVAEDAVTSGRPLFTTR